MPITLGMERSINLPPTFILSNHHYAVGNDVDVYLGLCYFGDFFGIFTCIFSKVLLLGHRNLPYLGLTFKHDRFAHDILWHEKPVILEPDQNGVAFAFA